MKKKIALIFAILLIVMSLVACGLNEMEYAEELENEPSMFVIVEETLSWKVVYHKETKVMYAVSSGSYNGGTFTLLVDQNGDPMIYGEDYAE